MSSSRSRRLATSPPALPWSSRERWFTWTGHTACSPSTNMRVPGSVSLRVGWGSPRPEHAPDPRRPWRPSAGLLFAGNRNWDSIILRERVDELTSRLNVTVVHVLEQPPPVLGRGAWVPRRGHFRPPPTAGIPALPVLRLWPHPDAHGRGDRTRQHRRAGGPYTHRTLRLGVRRAVPQKEKQCAISI